MTAEPTILLLGGRSEIGLAIVAALLEREPAHVVLAQRPSAKPVAELEGALSVEVLDFDAEALDTHEALVDGVFGGRRVATAVVAFGILGDQTRAWRDVAAAQLLMTVNATAAVGVGVALANAFARQSAGGAEPGTIIAVSSVAGVRVRRSNFVYGASKGAMDAFYLNLGCSVGPLGPRVVVVRPGAVATRMIDGKDPVALTVSPPQVAASVLRALSAAPSGDSARLVHVPAVFGPMMAMTHLVPRRLWERLKG